MMCSSFAHPNFVEAAYLEDDDDHDGIEAKGQEEDDSPRFRLISKRQISGPSIASQRLAFLELPVKL